MRNVYRKTARVRGRDYEKGRGEGGELRGRYEDEIGVHGLEKVEKEEEEREIKRRRSKHMVND